MKRWRGWKAFAGYRDHIGKMMDAGLDLEAGTVGERKDRFVFGQICLLAFALLLGLAILIGSLIMAAGKPGDIHLTRNSFGEGDREVPLILSQDGKDQEYMLHIGEQEISDKEKDRILTAFFADLAAVMAGDNPSLNDVSLDLRFPASIKGYPFSISYQPEDIDLVGTDGSLGPDTRALAPGDSRKTRIVVKVVYEDLARTHTYTLLLKARTTPDRTGLEKVQNELEAREADSRENEDLVLPAYLEGSRVKLADGGFPFPGLTFLLLVTIVLIVFRHISLKEKARSSQEEAESDFPLIVHLFALLMGAGLSFSSSLVRINHYYRSGRLMTGQRKAFNRLILLEDRLRDGVGVQEALKTWASSFSFPGYRRLALILSQCLSKGQREAVTMMEKEEEQAFRETIERARSRGEQARTRLLFPMIVLLAATMILIMFPAMAAFYQ